MSRSILTPVAVLIGAVLIIINGYKLMTSQGDPRKVQEGREGLTSAIIGIVFVLLAAAILNIILKSFLGKV
jgi:NADH:ubiquinone oxidoreductase subunit 6 (subunit J)